jgi:hypothetical protein
MYSSHSKCLSSFSLHSIIIAAYRLWAPAYNFIKSITVQLYNTMLSSNSKLLEFFTHIPKLEVDGSNWVIFKDRFLFAAAAASLKGHIDGTESAPVIITFSQVPGEALKEDQMEILKEQEMRHTKWEVEENIVKQALASVIPDSLFTEVRRKEMAALMWDAVRDQREKKSRMVTIDMRRKL